jgi:integrin beta 3
MAAMVDRLLDAVSVPLAALGARVKALEDRQPQKGDKGDPGQPGEPGRPGDPGRDGIGLAAAMINRAGELVITLSDGSLQTLGLVVGRDGDPGRPGDPGRDGLDGFGFDDLVVDYDGERQVTFRFTQSDRVKEFPVCLPIVLDRGVYRAEQEYERGDAVSFGGSLWIAQQATADKPETSAGWRLAVKRGRDGRSATK